MGFLGLEKSLASKVKSAISKEDFIYVLISTGAHSPSQAGTKDAAEGLWARQ